MVCKHCGKEINRDMRYCPYCGAEQEEAKLENQSVTYGANSDMEQTDTAKSPSDAPRRISRKGLIAIVIIVVAVVVVIIVGVGVSRSRSNRNTSSGVTRSTIISQPKLSSTNVKAAQKVIDSVDKYLRYETLEDLSYGSEHATQDILNAKQSLIAESDAATEEIRQEIIDYIDKIVDELELNEKSLSNVARIANEGTVTDRDKVESYRDQIEKLIKKYS